MGIELGGEPKDIGMPSRITSVPFTESVVSSMRLGRGKFESGPAMPCNTSYEERRFVFVEAGYDVDGEPTRLETSSEAIEEEDKSGG